MPHSLLATSPPFFFSLSSSILSPRSCLLLLQLGPCSDCALTSLSPAFHLDTRPSLSFSDTPFLSLVVSFFLFLLGVTTGNHTIHELQPLNGDTRQSIVLRVVDHPKPSWVATKSQRWQRMSTHAKGSEFTTVNRHSLMSWTAVLGPNKSLLTSLSQWYPSVATKVLKSLARISVQKQ